MLLNAETFKRTRVFSCIHALKQAVAITQVKCGLKRLFCFCLSPWWCVMFRGIIGVTVRPLWSQRSGGTLMAHTHSTMWAQAAHSLDHGNHRWLATALIFLYLYQFLSLFTPLTFSFFFLLSSCTQSSAPFINHICVISCKSSQSTSFDKFLFLILSFFQLC